MTSTFFAVLLEAVGNILTVHRDRLSSHLLVDVELLLQSADDYSQVFLSHLHNADVEHKYIDGKRFYSTVKYGETL